MKKTTKFLIILIILIILILIALIYMLKPNSYEGEGTPPNETEIKNYIEKKLTRVNNETQFNTVRLVANNYLNALLYKNSEKVYNMMDQNYTEAQNITIENVINKHQLFTKYKDETSIYLTLTINDMYACNVSDNVSIYFVSGYTWDSLKKYRTDIKIIIELDSLNNSFCIMPYEYAIENNIIKGENQDVNMTLDRIQPNDFNKFTFQSVTEEQKIKEYFEQFKSAIMYDAEESYKLLDNEYKEKKFESYSKYNEYRKDKILNIFLSNINEYQISGNTDEYKEYICIDQNNQYYIFRETSAYKFSVLLDEYTVDSQQFIKKYNSSNDISKVGYNISKCISAINDKDYKYVYSKLDEEFKESKYPSLDNFKKYIKDNLFEKNTIDAEMTSSSEKNIYIYNIKIKNTDNMSQEKSVEIIMKILEGTDFVMSFNIK